MSEEKVKAVEAEVQRLQDVKVIREVKYLVWLANTVPVKKKNGKWRMCVDFTDLNKACKKDDFPLERVDKIVDDAANSEMLSLLDMFSGYHQIRVHKEDEEKTSFITPFGTFCFVRMPEGLKNARCTFSRIIAMGGTRTYLSTSMGGTRNKVEGGDRHDLEPEGTREDIRHKIYTGSGSRSSYPTSCLE
jgi:hypothetical protein